MKRAITAELKVGEEMDASARRKMDSPSKHIAGASPERDVLYRKHLRQEEGSRGRGGGSGQTPENFAPMVAHFTYTAAKLKS
jgi:hypothetical protein